MIMVTWSIRPSKLALPRQEHVHADSCCDCAQNCLLASYSDLLPSHVRSGCRQVMKRSQGKVNPSVMNKILMERLNSPS